MLFRRCFCPVLIDLGEIKEGSRWLSISDTTGTRAKRIARPQAGSQRRTIRDPVGIKKSVCRQESRIANAIWATLLDPSRIKNGVQRLIPNLMIPHSPGRGW